MHGNVHLLSPLCVINKTRLTTTWSTPRYSDDVPVHRQSRRPPQSLLLAPPPPPRPQQLPQQQQLNHTEDETSGYISDATTTTTRRTTSPPQLSPLQSSAAEIAVPIGSNSSDMWRLQQQQQQHQVKPGAVLRLRPPLRLPHDEQFELHRTAEARGQMRGRRASPPRSVLTDATDLERETDFSVAK